ncbi:hypothetical protein ACFVMC_32370 [Nocardia sp. NPDC127579]|uniref:hypothetical protein n=1 Tax=Nocardia sp. NPDC127579 TaxID=3345402 RepID=UPI003630BA32
MEPIRGVHISGVDWNDETADIRLGSAAVLTVAYDDVELSSRSLAADDPDRHPIRHWSNTEVEEIFRTTVVSPVLFKTGNVRLGLRNGWNVFVSGRPGNAGAVLRFGADGVWTRSGWSCPPEYPIIQVDKWTARRIVAPPWPGRPADLRLNYGSDDIND